MTEELNLTLPPGTARRIRQEAANSTKTLVETVIELVDEAIFQRDIDHIELNEL